MAILHELRASFQKKLDACLEGDLTTAEKRTALGKLLSEQRDLRSKINRRPYADPDDRYEDMANDYADFLDDHYRDMIKKCQDELKKL